MSEEHRHPVSEEPRHITAFDADLKLVSHVAGRVEIRDVRLVSMNAHMDLWPPEVPVDWGREATVNFDAHPHIEGWREDPTKFNVAAFFSAQWGPEGISGDDPDTEFGIEIMSIFDVSYEFSDPEGITEEQLEHFAGLNAVYNSWPYFRNVAQSVTAQMGIAPLVIPVFRVPGGRPTMRGHVPPELAGFLDEMQTPKDLRHPMELFLEGALSWPGVTYRLSGGHLKGLQLLRGAEETPFAWAFPKTGKLQFRYFGETLPDDANAERGPKGVKYRLGPDASVEAALELAKLAYADPERTESA